MSAFGKALRFTRGLRFRLAFSYVFFFTILLVLLGIVFRQTLSATFQAQMASVLDEEWGAAKGYLRTGPHGPDWFYDPKDPDESLHRGAAARVYMLADTQGHPLQWSVDLQITGRRFSQRNSGHSPLRTTGHRVSAKTAMGIPYMIRSGLMIDERRQQILPGHRPRHRSEQ